jgi:hypothetical protein
MNSGYLCLYCKLQLHIVFISTLIQSRFSDKQESKNLLVVCSKHFSDLPEVPHEGRSHPCSADFEAVAQQALMTPGLHGLLLTLCSLFLGPLCHLPP